MSHNDVETERLRFLIRVVTRERSQLVISDARVFEQPFTRERARLLARDTELAERVEAFCSRFGRLQDSIGHKLLPALLRALGEPIGAVIDNLDRAERFGWMPSADEWQTVRQLRNQMVHEYIEDPTVLANALNSGHERVPMLTSTADAMHAEAQQRGWLVAP